MTEQEFISDVKQELTVACAVPIVPKDAELKRIIKYAAEWFYKNFEDSVEERYYAIPKTVFRSDAFRRNRTIPMPDCVFSVFQLKKLKEDFSSSLSFDGTSDLGIDKFIFKDSANLGFGSESLMYYVVNLFWLDTTSHIMNHTITYNFNRNSHKLFIGGETPDRDIVASCFVKMDLEFLFNEEVFYRYVVATAKTQMSRVIGTFKYPLPGGVEINYDLLREEGKDMLKEIKEEIRKDEGMDFFFTTGGG
jgi:hypothetical protein